MRVLITLALLASSTLALATERDCIERVGQCSVRSTNYIKTDPFRPVSTIAWRSDAGFTIRYRGTVERVLYEISTRDTRSYDESSSCTRWHYGSYQSCRSQFSESSTWEYRRTPVFFYLEEVSNGFDNIVSAESKDERESRKMALQECRMERERVQDFLPWCEENRR